MPELPDLGIVAEYGELPLGDSHYTKGLHDLLVDIEKGSSLLKFRDQLFALIQLYSHEIVKFILRIGVETQIDQYGKPIEYSAQELTDVLDDLMNAGVIFTGRFYSGNHDIDDARELVLRHDTLLDRFSRPAKEAKYRNLTKLCWNLQNYGKVIYSKLRDTEIDLIVPIFSGGIEPACLTRYILGRGKFYNLRYSRLGECDRNVKYVGLSPTMALNKKILVCEDWLETGISSNAVIDELAKSNPAEITLAAPVHINHSKIVYEFEEKIAGTEFYGRLCIPLKEKQA